MTRITIEPFRLTVEQVLSMAKGQAGRRQIRSMAGRDRWLRCGRAGASIWGEYATPNRDPIRIRCDLSTLTVSCSCHSRQRPCHHGPALYLRWIEQPECFTEELLPEWPAQDAERSQSDPTPGDEAQWPNVRRGLHELELWLHDLMRAGIAGLPDKPKDDWQAVGDRLADAHLDGLARAMVRLATLPGVTPHWPEKMLVELGRIHLMIQAFKERQRLSSTAFGDLRLAAGWVSNELLQEGERVDDRWQVIADEHSKEGPLSRQRIWLWSEGGNRPAALTRRAMLPTTARAPACEALLPIGVSLDGALHFYPASTAIQGRLAAVNGFSQPEQRPLGQATIEEALGCFREAVVQNPWLDHFPFLIGATSARRIEGRWRLVDKTGASLPIDDHFTRGWHLRALEGAADAAVFGLWNGGSFQPISLWADRQWLRLDSLRGIQ